ncbi:CRISPR-associated endonuclease Cas6 [Proteiniphilum sp. X52]|uniref:CRISPR-associated endonuclease Cas6 n=1 Tax=Proteiniphilum sp. X52 TaxID=2382159 RepID=UPI0011CDBADF|nr:CRISPR-associated endonuclease Cas6 [Proteiniphilum sp. X52]
MIRFQNELPFSKLESFRGAIIHAFKDKDVLFHNHLDKEGFRYAYPMIQYKRIRKKAAILCIEAGTEAVGKLFLDSDLMLNIAGKEEAFVVEGITAYKYLIQIWETRFVYRIRRWLALNQENYGQFQQLESVAEKSAFLENVLKANILSFAKGLDIFFDRQVECKITRLGDPAVMQYKGVKMTVFDAEFITNVSIPDYVGLGKGASLGYGVTVRKKEKTTQNR